MREITIPEFEQLWLEDLIKTQDIITVGNKIVAIKKIHMNPTDLMPNEIVYCVVP